MSGSAKVLTGLMERRALESAFGELAKAGSLDVVMACADEIARHGAALPVLLSLLDTDDPQLRGGLGQVAARLERDQVVPALRGVVRSSERGEQARISAVTILELFLKEPVDDSLLVNLQHGEAAAMQSLRELVQAMDQDPRAILEYLAQLAEQPPEVAGIILDAVSAMPPQEHLVTLLRMFAQDEDPVLAETAVDRLSRTRSPAALEALATLAKTLPPSLAALASRGERKLSFSGVRRRPDGEIGVAARAFMSPIDGLGSQLIWFAGRQGTPEEARLVGVVVNDPLGIVASFGPLEIAEARWPETIMPGGFYGALQDAGGSAAFLQLPLKAGQQRIRESLELNWAGGQWPPPEFRLVNPWLWGGGSREDEAELPEPSPGACTPAQAAAILDHPVFAGWSWQTAQMDSMAGTLNRGPDQVARVRHITALAETEFGPEEIASYRRRLRSMAGWLVLAGETEAATLAQAAALHLDTCLPASSPLIRRLIGIGLDISVARRRSESLQRGKTATDGNKTQ